MCQDSAGAWPRPQCQAVARVGWAFGGRTLSSFKANDRVVASWRRCGAGLNDDHVSYVRSSRVCHKDLRGVVLVLGPVGLKPPPKGAATDPLAWADGAFCETFVTGRRLRLRAVVLFDVPVRDRW